MIAQKVSSWARAATSHIPECLTLIPCIRSQIGFSVPCSDIPKLYVIKSPSWKANVYTCTMRMLIVSNAGPGP